jgi:hypothetical protein
MIMIISKSIQDFHIYVLTSSWFFLTIHHYLLTDNIARFCFTYTKIKQKEKQYNNMGSCKLHTIPFFIYLNTFSQATILTGLPISYQLRSLQCLCKWW